jgi:D-3-phosphoglycerate dehydrogenase
MRQRKERVSGLSLSAQALRSMKPIGRHDATAATDCAAGMAGGGVAEICGENCGVIAGIMKKANPDVNMVSAPVIAKERGVKISTTNQDKSGAFDGYIKVTVVTDKRERSVAGTVFSDGKPRFIQIKGINIAAEIGANMLYTTNEDVPGIIGLLGNTMGKSGVNIANFTLGRSEVGGEAIALLYIDHAV